MSLREPVDYIPPSDAEVEVPDEMLALLEQDHELHMGPGEHPSGSPQEVHGHGGGAAPSEKKPRVGVRTRESSDGLWKEISYSFPPGGDWSAEPVGVLALDTLSSDFSGLAWVTQRDILRKRLPTVPLAAGETLIYRLGSRTPKSLENRNAGNIEAVINHLDHTNEEQIAAGDHIQVFKAKLGPTGEYERFQSGQSRDTGITVPTGRVRHKAAPSGTFAQRAWHERILHMGPDAHPSGSPQSAHAGAGGGDGDDAGAIYRVAPEPPYPPGWASEGNATPTPGQRAIWDNTVRSLEEAWKALDPKFAAPWTTPIRREPHASEVVSWAHHVKRVIAAENKSINAARTIKRIAKQNEKWEKDLTAMGITGTQQHQVIHMLLSPIPQHAEEVGALLPVGGLKDPIGIVTIKKSNVIQTIFREGPLGPFAHSVSTDPGHLADITTATEVAVASIPGAHWDFIRKPIGPEGSQVQGVSTITVLERPRDYHNDLGLSMIANRWAGVHRSTTGEIVLNATKFTIRQAPGIALHEVGHGFHAVLKRSANEGGQSYLTDVPGPPVSKYGKTSPNEEFAEAYAMYTSPAGRAYMKIRHEISYEYMRRLFEAPPSEWLLRGETLKKTGPGKTWEIWYGGTRIDLATDERRQVAQTSLPLTRMLHEPWDTRLIRMLHMGPDAHPSGSPQDVHGHGGGGGAEAPAEARPPRVEPIWEDTVEDLRRRDPGIDAAMKKEATSPKYEEYTPEELEALSRRWDWRTTHQKAMTRAVALGQLDPKEASKKLNWSPVSSEPSQWKELPPTLYHVTTAKDAVLADGLKSRQELGMTHGGAGLGGGSSDTISFTDDPKIAKQIRRGILEASAVTKGQFTPAEMVRLATSGAGADKPWMPDLIRYFAQYHDREDRARFETWKPGDDYPDGLKLLLANEEYVSATSLKDLPGIGLAVSPADIPPGARPAGDGWMGGDGIKRYPGYYRPSTPKERRDNAFQFYKTWTTYREGAGGPMDPLFFTSSEDALQTMDPRQIAVLRVTPHPGTRGYQVSALGEWRTTTGQAIKRLEEVHHQELSEWELHLGPGEHPSGSPQDAHGGGGSAPPGEDEVVVRDVRSTPEEGQVFRVLTPNISVSAAVRGDEAEVFTVSNRSATTFGGRAPTPAPRDFLRAIRRVIEEVKKRGATRIVADIVNERLGKLVQKLGGTIEIVPFPGSPLTYTRYVLPLAGLKFHELDLIEWYVAHEHVLHMGPGSHPSGSSQDAHGEGGGGGDEDPSSSESIARSFAKAGQAVAAQRAKVEALMATLDQPIKVRNKTWTKQVIAGDTFWTDGTKYLPASQLFENYPDEVAAALGVDKYNLDPLEQKDQPVTWSTRKVKIQTGDYDVSQTEVTQHVTPDGLFTITPTGVMSYEKDAGFRGTLSRRWRWRGYRVEDLRPDRPEWEPRGHRFRTVAQAKNWAKARMRPSQQLCEAWGLDTWPTDWHLAEADEDCQWVTLDNGVKVCIQKSTGIVTKGPEGIKGQHIRDVRSPTKPPVTPVKRSARDMGMAPIDAERQDFLDQESAASISRLDTILDEAIKAKVTVPTTAAIHWLDLTNEERHQTQRAWEEVAANQVYQGLLDSWKDEHGDIDPPDKEMPRFWHRAKGQARLEWLGLAYEEQFDAAKLYGIVGEAPLSVPKTWSLFDADEPGYKETQIAARYLTEQRATKIYRERFPGRQVPPDWSEVSRTLWGSWKKDSNSEESLVLQQAAIAEFGANNHLTPRQEATVPMFAKHIEGGQDAAQAYARSLWETNQFLLHKAGLKEVTVYRAVMLPKAALDKTEATVHMLGGPHRYITLPTLKLRQNALQSTSFSPGTPNSWQGVGFAKGDLAYKRVVVSATIPATAVFSLPVFGQNVQQEQETVILGTPWKSWTAWFERSPNLSQPWGQPAEGTPVGALGDYLYKLNKQLTDVSLAELVVAWGLPGWPTHWHLAEADEDCQWVTLDNGAKVCIQKSSGLITKGPDALKGQHIRDVRSPTQPKGPKQLPLPGLARTPNPEDEPRLEQLEAFRQEAVEAGDRIVEKAIADEEKVEVGATSWEELSEGDQDSTRSSWEDDHFDSIYEQTVDAWRENDAANEMQDEFAKDDSWWREQINAALDDTPDITDEERHSFAAVLDDAELRGRLMHASSLPYQKPEFADDARWEHFTQGLAAEASRELDTRVENADPPDHLKDNAIEEVGDAFNNLDDDEKYKAAKDAGYGPTYEKLKTPETWNLFESEGEGYKETQAVARHLVQARAKELWAARKKSKSRAVQDMWASSDPNWDHMAQRIWSSWKGDSNSGPALALQKATIDELGANNHLTPDQETTAVTRMMGLGGEDAVRTYVRALWDTNQYLLKQAGMKDVTLYRAVYLPKEAIDDKTDLDLQVYQKPGTVALAGGGDVVIAAPKLKLRQNAAQSTAFGPEVPNSWQGVGSSPRGGRRVVVQMKVPPSAVISLPVFGQNVHKEKEVVVLGTPWNEWTAWVDKAPREDLTKFGPPKTYSSLKALPFNLP